MTTTLIPPRAEWRRLYRYWVRDTLVGARLLAAHHAMKVLPTDTVSNIGARLGMLAGPRLHPAADRRIRAALTALRPDLVPDQASLDAATQRAWASLGRAYAEFSVQDRFWPEGRITVDGAEHLERARAEGRPVIVAAVHLANWEAVPITFGYLGHRFVQIVQPPANRFESRIAADTRERIIALFKVAAPGSGTRLLQPSASIGSDLLRALRGGESIGFFVDEYVGRRVQAPAFGRPLAAGANIGRVMRLARLGNAVVVPAYTVRTQGAQFTVRYLPHLPLQASGDRDADMKANMAALDAVITPTVLAHIEHWFMLPDFRIDR